MTEQATRRSLARRRLLHGLSAPLAAILFQLPIGRAEAAVRERSVLLHHRHTGETLRSVYYADGRYQPAALAAATHHLRDWRDQTQLPVDPKLLDLLWSLRSALETSSANPGVLRLPLARDQRHAAAHAARRRPPQPAHAGDGDRSAGRRPIAERCTPRGSGAERWWRGLLSALRLRSRRHRRHPLLVSLRPPGVPFRARPGTASSAHGPAGLTTRRRLPIRRISQSRDAGWRAVAINLA